ncbi:5-formyltetrahydrofolate cyclo-ligase [Sphingorhabdus arenilitoris]|uniref:5-formyltetrahydrofolate cyclo-ligase n=1 Tax=Sphingorhabdus arenilitoris TaxID=1490041 RepID=A0ABV8RH02_9SPHN
MDILADKDALRRQYRQKREEYVVRLSPQDKELAFSAVPSPIKNLFQPDKSVAAFIPLPSEADPARLLTYAADIGCRTALPYVTGKAAPMQFLAWRPGDPLYDGPFNLQQPDSEAAIIHPDIVIVPLVAFDRSLNRLGQGAGHYDRALSLLSDSTAIGLAWSVQEHDFLPADPWDMPLDAILTEKEWITR